MHFLAIHFLAMHFLAVPAHAKPSLAIASTPRRGCPASAWPALQADAEAEEAALREYCAHFACVTQNVDPEDLSDTDFVSSLLQVRDFARGLNPKTP
jgi:hypothetical protein